MKPIRVFISSRMDELKEERTAVEEVICDLWNNENLPLKVWRWEKDTTGIPSKESPDEIQDQRIEESDVYLLILGSEYGVEEGLSPTHREYNKATKSGLFNKDGILIYVKKVEKREKKLEEWIREIQEKQYTWKTFENTYELKGLVKDRLRALCKDRAPDDPEGEFPTRILEEIKESISDAKESIDILGIVGYRPIHESYHKIIQLINKGGKVRILIMNPNTLAWKKVEKNENDTVGRLRMEHNAVMVELKGIYSQIQESHKHLIKVKLIDIEPEASIQIIDAKKMYVNPRPPKENLGERGYEQRMFLVVRDLFAHKRTFEHYFNLFNDIYSNGDISHEVNLEKN